LGFQLRAAMHFFEFEPVPLVTNVFLKVPSLAKKYGVGCKVLV
jgi:hypothetical protein